MKSLELKTNKRLLIVEYATEAKFETEIGLLKALTPSKIIEFGHILEFICSGSDLTEEIAAGMVDSPDNFQFLDALNTFIGEVEKKGWHWGENPKQKDLDRCNEYTDMFTIAARVRAWQEAEARTLHPERVIIFEITS